MPIYRYLCPCGKVKERMRSINDRKKYYVTVVNL